MTEHEAERFLIDEAFVAFPAARKFLLLNSSDPAATAKLQARALWAVEIDEAREVLDLWLGGKAEPLTNQELENLAITIRRAALRHRFKASSSLQESREQVDASQVSPVDATPFYERMRAIGLQARNGIISQEQYLASKQEVLDEYDRACIEANRAAVNMLFVHTTSSSSGRSA